MARWWNRSRAPDPLGTGVWRRAEDRFRRAVDRYHQVLERVEAAAAAPLTTGEQTGLATSSFADGVAALHGIGAQQADLLARVHEICLSAQSMAPSDGEDIPPGPGGMLLDVHRALARAATLVAQAAESVTMVLVTLRAGRPEEAAAATLGARRATEQAAVHVARAEEILQGGSAHDGP